MSLLKFRKIYFGVIWLIAFIVLILAVGGGFHTISSFGSVVDKLYVRYTGPNNLHTRELVEEESNLISIVDAVAPSVVSIIVKTYDFDFFNGPTLSEEGIGTGFIVDSTGLIITNSHVVGVVGGEYSVVLSDGTTYAVDKVHLDEFSDLAILEITARDLPVVTLGDSDNLKVGQRAIAIGNALGRFQNTVTAGIVSGISRELTASGFDGRIKTYEGAIQTDAALNPGNSGGPLLNSSGQVIGINVATTRGADNISFAIPVNTLKPLLETFIAEGRIIRPYLGVSYTIVTKEVASLRNLPEGVFVSRVVPGSPADKAGMQRGDIMLSFDGKSLNETFTLAKAVAQSRVGATVTISVDRAGKNITLTATLEDTPENF